MSKPVNKAYRVLSVVMVRDRRRCAETGSCHATIILGGKRPETIEVRAKKPSLLLNLGINGLKMTSEPPPMAGQAGYLQGKDRSAVTHPSSSHARRCLIWLSCDNSCTRYTAPLGNYIKEKIFKEQNSLLECSLWIDETGEGRAQILTCVTATVIYCQDTSVSLANVNSAHYVSGWDAELNFG
ncbi:hypothetical protein J6590_027635 [Homalodisca vitripennis]|nr:hypothetical protein J6590_027635 [Homalodisca vitripennis]